METGTDSMVIDITHWLERFMCDMWRRPFPSIFWRDRWLPIRPSAGESIAHTVVKHAPCSVLVHRR